MAIEANQYNLHPTRQHSMGSNVPAAVARMCARAKGVFGRRVHNQRWLWDQCKQYVKWLFKAMIALLIWAIAHEADTSTCSWDVDCH